jgi:stage II sporulation SpoAA-like protein
MAEYIEHAVHDNGIHEITFLDTKREAVDAYMSLLESLIAEMLERDSPEKLAILLNLTQTSELPAFSYITKKGRHMLLGHLKDRDKLHVRTAFLAQQNAMMVLSLAENFIKLLPVDMQMKAFEGNQRDEAIDWVLADK